MLTAQARDANRESFYRDPALRTVYAHVLSQVMAATGVVPFNEIVADERFGVLRPAESALLKANAAEIYAKVIDALPAQYAARLIPTTPGPVLGNTNAQLKLAPGLVDRLPENIRTQVRAATDGSHFVPATLADELAKAGLLVQGDSVIEKPAAGPRVPDPARFELSAQQASDYPTYQRMSEEAAKVGRTVTIVR